MNILHDELKSDLINRGFSRRNFGRIAAMITAGATLPFYNEPALAQLSKVNAPPDAVLLNANENPLGPCKEAREAAARMIEHGGRYRYSEADRVQQLLAQQEGVKPEYVRIYAGSSAPLHQAVLAFTGPKRPFVMADPGYESGASAATFIGAETIRVPLMKDKAYAHDVKAMVAASPTAGLIYICNPNNPTGTLTPPSDIEWLVANKPAGCIVMIDEAYTHIAGAPVPHRHGGRRQGRRRSAHLLQDLRYGRPARRRRHRASGPSQEARRLQCRHDADYGHGRRQREPGGEVRHP